MANLTRKQEAFVNAYILNGFNATNAALSAGYSPDSAASIGSENLRKPEIRELIDAFFDDHAMKSREVISRLTEHARGDIGDLWDESSGQIDWKKARETGRTHLIKKIKHKTTRVTREDGTDVETFEDEVELHNPQFALQLLGKQHGLFVDRQEIKHSGEVLILKTGMDMDDL